MFHTTLYCALFVWQVNMVLWCWYSRSVHVVMIKCHQEIFRLKGIDVTPELDEKLYLCYIDWKLWQWVNVAQIEMCSNPSTAKHSLLVFCVGFSMPFVRWYFSQDTALPHFFTFTQWGAVDKVVKESRYTYISGQSLTLFVYVPVMLFSVNGCQPNLVVLKTLARYVCWLYNLVG